MSIPLKSETELTIMAEGGRKLAQVFKQVFLQIKPGVSLISLDTLAEKLIKQSGGQPSFKAVRDYRWTTCICVNQGVVHGIPGNYRIKNGDIVSLDMGMHYRGFHTDMARTLEVRNSKSEILNSKFLETGKRALQRAISVAKPGNRVGHISQAIETEIKKAGYRPVEVLTGHGIGKNLHEDPQIFGLLQGKVEDTPVLELGMALAIEIIYVQRKPDLVMLEDGWTIETEDRSLAGLFEDTVALTQKGTKILTNFRP